MASKLYSIYDQNQTKRRKNLVFKKRKTNLYRRTELKGISNNV